MRRVELAAALLILLVPAAAYVRSTTGNDPTKAGACLYWTTRHLTFTVNDRGTGVPYGCDPATTFAAVEASFQAWASAGSSPGAPCTDLQFSPSTTSDKSTGYDPHGPNTNLIVWRQGLCKPPIVPQNDPCLAAETCANTYNCWDNGVGSVIALTTTTFNVNTGELLDSDTELFGWDGNTPTASSPLGDAGPWYFTCVSPGAGQSATSMVCRDYGDPGCIATDVQNTMTHEAGHFLGLAHSPVRDSTMFASASLGDISKRTLSSDDIQGICSIYPRGQATATCGDTKSSSGCGCGSGGATGGAVLLAALLALRPRARRWKR